MSQNRFNIIIFVYIYIYNNLILFFYQYKLFNNNKELVCNDYKSKRNDSLEKAKLNFNSRKLNGGD